MTEIANSRRQFLRRVGGTFAAGVGMAVVPAVTARASTASLRTSSPPANAGRSGLATAYLPPPRRGIKLAPDVCGISCQPSGCTTSGCPPMYRNFHCLGCGYDYYQCYKRTTCTSFCECQGCC